MTTNDTVQEQQPEDEKPPSQDYINLMAFIESSESVIVKKEVMERVKVALESAIENANELINREHPLKTDNSIRRAMAYQKERMELNSILDQLNNIGGDESPIDNNSWLGLGATENIIFRKWCEEQSISPTQFHADIYKQGMDRGEERENEISIY